ncbi:Fungal specific transcription factor domain [Geosmithia morbida]|uniref:Fungal specific transcription factor domain n=1 Tax=Geosmithia morbida TaxID=1094350 RepID=A0A9P4YT98_9HYPO|nr:Fungal specific transcription factor domain [Geosmithia morbida]KAF4122706.1 Fungal specific transcription factor domain [Geosmithia morbida]
MSPERDDNVEGADDMHYPSPGAEPMDAGPFYQPTGRDDQQPDGMEDQQQQHQQPEDQQQQADHIPEHQQHDGGGVAEDGLADHTALKQDGTTELHHHDQQPEPSTPQQQQSTRPANIEELQLAAQLGQGLTGTPMIPPSDANMSVDESSLRNIMPHPDPDQQHQQHQQTPAYGIHDTPTSESIITHGLQVAQLPPHYSLGDNIPPRKRSKVSRACDECRRKKIKCDAQTDTGDAPCSSCSRSNIRCLFSRVPQKRGPSKGYIKELADRIHSIENKLDTEGGLTQEDLSGLFGDRQPRHSNVGDDLGRKRHYSSISGGEIESPMSARQTPWAPDSARPLHSQDGQPATPFDSSSLAPQPIAPRLDETLKTAMAPMDAPMEATIDDVIDVDEGVLQDYLATLQGLYPILPHSQARLESLLAACNPLVKTAFANALLAVAQSSSGNVKLANFLLSSWESSDSPPSQATNIVHAQALLLLLIDADWRGSSSTLPSLLGRAVSLANTMRLWRYTAPQPGSDADSDENLGIRIWWSLVLMDRWHAVGTGSPVLIPDSSVVMPPDLDTILGETCSRLLRLSKVQSKISQVVATLPADATTADPLVARMMADYVENFREDQPAHVTPETHPLVHLGFWHCRILVALLTSGLHWTELMAPTRELVNLLSADADMRSPLTNHFGFLVALALSWLSRNEGSRDEALQLMRDLLERPGGVWDSIRDRLADQASRPAPLTGDAASLQHLADLATTGQKEGAENAGATGKMAYPSLIQGYLTIP